MTDQNNGCQSKCWLWAAVAGLLVAAKLLLISHMGFVASVFLGLLVFGILGSLLVWAFCQGREDLSLEPAKSTPVAAPVEAAPVADAPKPAPVVTAHVDATPELKAPTVKAEPTKPAVKKAAPKAKAEGDTVEGKKPRGLKAPRKAGADDLKVIEGVGPKLEEILNSWGIYHYDQIAKWGAAEVAYADANVPRFKGRCTRDKWVAQTKIIVEEGIETFLERAKTNDY